MHEHETEFNKNLILCIIALIGVVLAGGLTSKYLDSRITPLTLLVSHSSEAPQYPQKIAFYMSVLKGQFNEYDYENHKKLLSKTIEKIESRIAVSEDYFAYFPQINALKDAHLNQKAISYSTKGDVLVNFLIISKQISTYFNDQHQFSNEIPKNIRNDIRQIQKISESEISDILSERVEIFNHYIEEQAQEILRIRFGLIIFFTTLIFFIIAYLFYPMHRRTQSLLAIVDRQKNQFEIEKNRFYLASQATNTGIWD